MTGANLVQVLGTAGMFGMFFLGSLYLRRILRYDPLQIGLAFLPAGVVMGALSVRYTDRPVMRFGARKLLFPGLADRRRAGPVRHDPGRRDVPELRLPGYAADRNRCRPVLPRADDAGHVQCHTAGRRPGLGSAEHHGPSRRRAGARGAGHRVRVPNRCADRTWPPVAVALTDGYHLAFWIAFGLVAAAIAVAATVLRPQRPAAGPASAETMQQPVLAGATQAGCAD